MVVPWEFALVTNRVGTSVENCLTGYHPLLPGVRNLAMYEQNENDTQMLVNPAIDDLFLKVWGLLTDGWVNDCYWNLTFKDFVHNSFREGNHSVLNVVIAGYCTLK